MTDLEKFKNLFDDIGIKYSIDKTKIIIDDDFVYISYSNCVEINFDDNGEFIEFQGWGE